MRLLPRDPQRLSAFVKALVQAAEKSLAEDGPTETTDEAGAGDRPSEGGSRARRRRKT